MQAAAGARPIERTWEFSGVVSKATKLGACVHPAGQATWRISGGGTHYTGTHVGGGDTRCVTLKRLKPPLPPATTTAADTEPPQVEALPSRGALEKCTSRGTLSYGARALYDFVDKHGWRFFDADLTEVGTQKTGHRRQFD